MDAKELPNGIGLEGLPKKPIQASPEYRQNLTIADVTGSKYRLQIERVPRPMWGINLRSIIPERWAAIANLCGRANGFRCSICYGSGLERGRSHAVEAHEVWHYDDLTHIQSLIGIQALCPNCHRCKHPGMAEAEGYDHTVHLWLMKVNGISRAEAIRYCQESLDVARYRSRFPWTLDISRLDAILAEMEARVYG